jgi:hypothetical protein
VWRVVAKLPLDDKTLMRRTVVITVITVLLSVIILLDCVVIVIFLSILTMSLLR